MEELNSNQKVAGEKKKSKNLVWVLALSIMSGLILGLAFMLYTEYSAATNLATSLESTYQKSYYDLSDKINNMEIKLSKVVVSGDKDYSAKMLSEISKNAEDAQNNLNVLPVSLNGVKETLTFINQVGGYTGTLSKKLLAGKTLSESEIKSLEDLHSSLKTMKTSMNAMSEKMWSGYSILNDGLSLKGDYNDLTVNLREMKSADVDYPTMIYDGPFSDTQLKKEIKGLSGQDVSLDDAKKVVADLFSMTTSMINDEGTTKSNFETYNLSFKKSNISYYAQVTIKGGKLLTLSSCNDSNEVNFSKDEALKSATDFVKKSGINDMTCVWSDSVGKDAYFNFAPQMNGIIIYPDLVKLKVDLAHGEVVGYEANSYYTNHEDRQLGTFTSTLSSAKSQVKSGYAIKQTNKVLAPIDYEEVLCYEFNTLHNGDIYYFYIDATTGQLVNVLRVIRTSDGTKLM